MGDLIGAREAASRLRISVSSLYAYVSRGALRRIPGPDGRSSLYDADEVEALATRSRPRTKRRAPASIDLLVATRVSTVADGVVRYRGIGLTDLVEGRHSFEAVAELLWEATPAERDAGWAQASAFPGVAEAHGDAISIVPRLMDAVVRTRPDAGPESSARPLSVDWSAAGRTAIGAMLTVGTATTAAGPPGSPGRTTVAARYGVATALWRRWSPLVPTPSRVRALNTALVLLAEHELALSTIAVRVAASARARPELCVAAGLATLGGDLHGRASVTLHERLRAPGLAPRDDPPRADDGMRAGFGHVIHRTDPRTSMLLDAVWPLATAADRRRIAALAREEVAAANVDLALAALAFVARMPPGATLAIFAVARTAGWIAHAREEYGERPLRFRGHATPASGR